MTVQYVRLTAYTKSVARRHRDAGRSRGLHGPGTRAGRRAARPGPFVPKEGTMSTEPAVTMQDLELEHAELLPNRETLWSYGGHSSYSVTNVVGSTSQVGLINVSAF